MINEIIRSLWHRKIMLSTTQKIKYNSTANMHGIYV